MSKELKEIYGAERVLKIKTFLEMIVYTDELSKINLEYLMDNAEVLLYAIEQAERVQELEVWQEKTQQLHESLKRQDEVLDRFRQQNKHYREALEFYADQKTYETNVVDQWEPVTPINNDKGLKARKALEGEE